MNRIDETTGASTVCVHSFGHRLHVHVGQSRHAEVLPQPLRGVPGDEVPASDERDLLAELLGLLEVVRRQQDGGALRMEMADVAPEIHPKLEVHTGGRLVEDDQPGVVHQGARQQQPPPLPARELGCPNVALRLQAEGLDELVRAGVGFLHPEIAAVVDQRLLHRQEPVEVDVLLGEADPGARLQRVVGLAEDEHLAVRDPQQVADRADQGGLARPVRPEQSEEGARGDLEVEVLERERAVVVSLRQAAQLERGYVVTEHPFETSGRERHRCAAGTARCLRHYPRARP
jgi:hypothetical protein